MQKATQDLMLSLIRAELCEDVSLLSDICPSEELLTNIYRLSSLHDLSHMVGTSLKKANVHMSDQLNLAYEKSIQRSIFRYASQVTVYDEICALLEKEKIPYLPLKGAVM